MIRLQPATRLTALLATLLGLAGCNPTFNWREVRPEGTRLTLLLPCKPDKAEKTVPLGGRDTALAMLGCETGGVTFAVAVAGIGEAAKAADVLEPWRRLSLAGIKAGEIQTRPLQLPGAAAPVNIVSAEGVGANGAPVRFSAAYFAQGRQVFQAVMLSTTPAPPADAAETFFSSLRFQ
jgi:hypothetical protein